MFMDKTLGKRRMAAYGLALIGTLGGGYTVASKVSQPAHALALSGAASTMTVQVSGAVKESGLFKLKAGARLDDALKAAGGATRDADLNRVNLADPLVDGCRIRIPRVDDPADVAVVTMPTMQPLIGGTKSGSSAKRPPGSWGKKEAPPAGGISLNQASIDELQKLPGVGPSTAQKILDFRAQVGGFKSIEQLMDVKGIGPKKFEKMRPYLRL